MPLTAQQSDAVLAAARALIGARYRDLDCSHFVHKAYASANLHYTYHSTDKFHLLVGVHFTEVTNTQDIQAADMLMFPGHVGLWDPNGCKVLQQAGTPSKECKRFNNQVPFLSSRSGKDLGPEFGMLKWFGDLQKLYRWK